MSAPAVDVAGLCRRIGGRQVLEGLDLVVPAGDVTALVGRNGAGKSTTLRGLLGLVHLDAGDGHVLGEPLSSPHRYLRSVGCVVDGLALHPGLAGRANLQRLAAVGDLSRDRVEQVLDAVGLRDRAGDRVGTYSLGMRQRLHVAAALLPEPRLLLLDEPFNGLDPLAVHELRGLLRELAGTGVAVLLATHQLSAVEQIAGHVVVLDEGRRVLAGTPAQVTRPHRSVFVVQVEQVPELSVLAGRLAARGWQVTRGPDGLEVTGPATGAQVARVAADAGVCLSGLTARRQGLEEAVLDVLRPLVGTS